MMYDSGAWNERSHAPAHHFDEPHRAIPWQVARQQSLPPFRPALPVYQNGPSRATKIEDNVTFLKSQAM